MQDAHETRFAIVINRFTRLDTPTTYFHECRWESVHPSGYTNKFTDRWVSQATRTLRVRRRSRIVKKLYLFRMDKVDRALWKNGTNFEWNNLRWMKALKYHSLWRNKKFWIESLWYCFLLLLFVETLLGKNLNKKRCCRWKFEWKATLYLRN